MPVQLALIWQGIEQYRIRPLRSMGAPQPRQGFSKSAAQISHHPANGPSEREKLTGWRGCWQQSQTRKAVDDLFPVNSCIPRIVPAPGDAVKHFMYEVAASRCLLLNAAQEVFELHFLAEIEDWPIVAHDGFQLVKRRCAGHVAEQRG